MNWGYKLLFVYAAFVIGIMLMVFKSSNQKSDLVTADYYAKELKYQDRIDALTRTKALSSKVTYQVVNGQLIISFPKEFEAKNISGTVLLYCPSDDNKDSQKEFKTSAGTVTIDLPAEKKVSHDLQINWQADDKAYYFEEKLVL